MAEIPVVLDPEYIGKSVLRVAKWSAIKAGDTCEVLATGVYPSKTLQVSGVPSGSTLAIKGRILPEADLVTLHDIYGVVLSFTAVPTQIYEILETPMEIAPVVTGGDEDTSWDVGLVIN